MGNFGYSLIITVLGISVTFLILAIIMFCLNVLKKAVNKEKPGEAEVKQDEPKAEIVPQAQNDEEIIAVITAAIAAAMGTSSSGLVIRSYRKISSNAPVWNIQGRNEALSNKIY